MLNTIRESIQALEDVFEEQEEEGYGKILIEALKELREQEQRLAAES